MYIFSLMKIERFQMNKNAFVVLCCLLLYISCRHLFSPLTLKCLWHHSV